jgi:hypothetical protein
MVGDQMKTAIVTICVGESFKKMAEVTHPTIRDYAERCGAEFIVIGNWGEIVHPGFYKFNLGELMGEFERILYVDTDVLIRDDAPDLFKEIPEHSFAAFNEGEFMDRMSSMEQFAFDAKILGDDCLQWIKGGVYFNTGIMMLPSTMRSMLKEPEKPIMNFYEQTQFNWELFKFATNKPDFKICQLSHRFNRMSHIDKRTGESRLDSFFLHYAGAVGSDGTRGGVVEVMKKDLAAWNDGPRTYRKNILMRTGGGIGDLVATEPVVRFAAERMWPGQNLVVQTAHHEIFQHIEGIKLIPNSMNVVDVGYYEVNLMPKPENPVNNYLTHLLTHPTDYASIMLLKGQIPIAHRKIKLQSDPLIGVLEERLKNCVLIHAGKGWPSKTFPMGWWDSVIGRLQDAGIDVALIGQRGEYNSVVELETQDCLDLRDKLSLPQLFRAVELAPILISNDSSPVHIAGAFDNWIGLVASCKHPDRILPWRNGSQRHKASALNVGLIEREFRPNCPDTVTMDEATEEEVLACLPEPEQVLNWVLKIPSGLKLDIIKP